MSSKNAGPGLVGLIALVSVACDGSWQRPQGDAGRLPDAGGMFDAASHEVPHIPPRDAAVIHDSSTEGPETDASDGAALEVSLTETGTLSDADGDIVTAPLPGDAAPPLRVVPGPARLVGGGTSACTNQDPPSGNGDRWCGFKRPASVGSGTELWVLNVSATASMPAACDGTSPLCLRLTDGLWTDEPFGGPAQSIAHRFDGDTLFFHTPGSSGKDQPFRGPVWAWRPGWSQARRIADNALICYGDRRSARAFCIDNTDGSSAIEFDLTVGSLADPAGPPLVTVDRARVRRADGEQAFLGMFSRDGRQLIYSTTPRRESNLASLRIWDTEPPAGTPGRDILPDVLSWQIANDDQKVYYLAEYSADRAEGSLMMADFPTGANPAQIARRTGRYVVLDDGSGKDRGVGYFVVGTGRFLSDYRVVPDRSDLGSNHVVFRYKDLLEDFHLSKDQRFTGYAKLDAKEGFNGYLARNDGSGECIINSERGRPGFEYEFLDDSGLVFWAEESRESTTVQDGWLADPSGCLGKRRFAPAIGYYTAIRNDGLVFGDHYDGETVSLKYAVIEDGRRWPAGGAVRVRDQVDLPVVRLGARSSHLVFQVSRGAAEETGIYVFGPLPFGR